MRISIMKTREGERPKKVMDFNRVAEAREYLKSHWNIYKEMWGKPNYWEGFSDGGKVLKYDVYKFEIVKDDE